MDAAAATAAGRIDAARADVGIRRVTAGPAVVVASGPSKARAESDSDSTPDVSQPTSDTALPALSGDGRLADEEDSTAQDSS